MQYAVEPLAKDLPFGVIVTDLDPADLADPALRRSLYDLWVDKGVIVFRGMPGEGGTQMALSRIFGSPEVHPLRDPSRTDSVPELSDIFFKPEDGDILRFADGERKGGYLPWHFDLVYLPRINHGGILRAVTKAPHGGETGFLDRIAIHDALPDRLKARIDGLYVTYLYDPWMEHQRYGRAPGMTQERLAVRAEATFHRMNLPPVAHPLVFVQPETGRRMLNFSPWYATGIEGIEQSQADTILEEITSYAQDERHAYFHRWDGDDMVLWDNWRMLHCATGVPADEARHMQRTTIHGDYGVGRIVKPAETAAA
ncbi:TauD/TfdA dioxygenase family protein [Sphingomonas bacterium]|uniref:TauD/TfdA dioxygenase family protein n=1 Tax=Sphingomonas bacterium TaxID=1895847 RepID=UPI0015764167|nr:TauD/TfdA family dioxygenase [Sphingomonas bacterium]